MTIVARDQWPLIKAFRDSGAHGFHQLGLARARESYETSCAREGLPPRPIADVTDMTIDGSPVVAARVYRHRLAGDNPVVVFVHGGGWAMGSLNTHDTLCRYLAFHTAAAVLSVGFRLAPDHVYPAAFEDVLAVLDWIRTHGSDFGLDPERIVVAGDDAGAHLAADAAQHDDAIQAQVLLCPVTSASTNTPSYEQVADGFPFTADTMRWFLHLYTDGAAVVSDAAVRDLAIDPRALPTFLCTVGHDPLASGGADYARSLVDAGALVHHIHLPEHAHGLFTSSGVVRTGEHVLAEAVWFISTMVWEQPAP